MDFRTVVMNIRKNLILNYPSEVLEAIRTLEENVVSDPTTVESMVNIGVLQLLDSDHLRREPQLFIAALSLVEKIVLRQPELMKSVAEQFNTFLRNFYMEYYELGDCLNSLLVLAGNPEILTLMFDLIDWSLIGKIVTGMGHSLKRPVSKLFCAFSSYEGTADWFSWFLQASKPLIRNDCEIVSRVCNVVSAQLSQKLSERLAVILEKDETFVGDVINHLDAGCCNRSCLPPIIEVLCLLVQGDQKPSRSLLLIDKIVSARILRVFEIVLNRGLLEYFGKSFRVLVRIQDVLAVILRETFVSRKAQGNLETLAESQSTQVLARMLKCMVKFLQGTLVSIVGHLSSADEAVAQESLSFLVETMDRSRLLGIESDLLEKLLDFQIEQILRPMCHQASKPHKAELAVSFMQKFIVAEVEDGMSENEMTVL